MQSKNKIKNIISSIVAMILGAVTILAAFFGGIQFKNSSYAELSGMLSDILTGLLFVILAVNIIYGIVKRNKMQKMKVSEVNEMMLKRKANIKENFELATKRLRKISLWGKLYIVFITVYMHVTAFFIGAQADASGRLIILIIFMTGGIYIRFLGAIIDKPKVVPEDFLSRVEYPELYSIAKEAMEKAGVEGKVYIATANSFDASISKIGDAYLLFIGAIMINSLSRKELFNVLLHEFAHHAPEYTPKSLYGFFNRFIEHETDGSRVTDIIISLPMMKYGEEFVFYTLLASEYIESMADAITVKLGSPKHFASAIAKCNFYDSYDNVLFKYQEKPLFEPENVTPNVATLNLNAFIAATKDNHKKWLANFEKEIQPRNATHPIYRMRRDAIGVKPEDVVISFDFEDDGLQQERLTVISKINSEIAIELGKNYEELRKVNYLDPLAIVDNWKANKENYSSADLIPVIDALSGLMRFDEAEALCDEIIANEKNVYATAYPKHFKGVMMLLREEEKGIDLLYKAIELNSNLLEISINQIGEYACKHGMQKELDEYREKATALTQKMIDEDEKANSLSPSDKVVEDDMSEEALESHVSFISAVSENISGIYLVKKVISETFSSHVFLIEFDKGTSQEVINEAMNKIFRYLDTLDDEQYSLFLYNNYYKGIVKKVKNSLKYSKR